jgi:sortase A
MRRAAGILLAGTLVLASCSSGDDDASVAPVATSAAATTTTTVTRSTATTAAAPSTTAAAPSTTAPPASTGTTPTTAAPPTTVALPTPEPPPPEDGTTEPRVQVGSIEIPAIGLSASMFEGIRLSTLNNGPGHWPGTAMPGQVGNAVIAGHRVSHHADFRHLDDLVAGDEVIMTTDAGRFVYTVVSSEIVKPDALWVVDQTPEATATLFACHPPGRVSERIVVHLALSA